MNNNKEIKNVIEKFIENNDKIYLYNNNLYIERNFNFNQIIPIDIYNYFSNNYTILFNQEKNTFAIYNIYNGYVGNVLLNYHDPNGYYREERRYYNNLIYSSVALDTLTPHHWEIEVETHLKHGMTKDRYQRENTLTQIYNIIKYCINDIAPIKITDVREKKYE